MSRQAELIRRAVVAAATVAAASALLACGSSSPSNPVAPAVKASHDTITSGTKTHHPLAGTGAGEVNDDNPAAGGASANGSATSSGSDESAASSASAARSGAAKKARGQEKQKEPTGAAAAHSFNPCTLVTRSEAETILGHRIAKPALAPLGPSCIYRVPGSKTTVTVAVQATSFSALKSRLKKTQHKTVDGRTATCGIYGQPTTIVALSRGRVLTIAASCPVGFRFAAKALTRV